MEYEEPVGYIYYDLLVDVIFFADIIIRFNTPVYYKGRLITSHKSIAYKYVTSWFIFDLLCCIPLSYFRLLSVDMPRGGNE